MMRPLTIALAGNPNSGKSTLFNALTGGRAHVANYPGITVDKKEGRLQGVPHKVRVVDLPGAYSLTAYSREELVARDMLALERPDAVVDVIDAGSLERNLYLAVQLLELGAPLVLALNMMDEATKRGLKIDSAKLGRLLHLPVAEVVATKGAGVPELTQIVTDYAAARAQNPGPWQPLVISYGPDLDLVIDAMSKAIEQARFLTDRYPARWVAIKYLENDTPVMDEGRKAGAIGARLETMAAKAAAHCNGTLDTYPEAIIADYRYGFISSILKGGVLTRDDRLDRIEFSDKIDRLLTHTLFGPVIMLGVLYLVYQITFSLGKFPMDWLQAFFDWVGEAVQTGLPDGLLRSLLVDGIIAGVGGVMGFVPLVMLIFLLIAILEDSGYMARIAYMLDRVLRTFGLHGCSVMPFIISGGIAGGCAVPGIMASRTLRSPKERLATILTAPFMTCGAKLPVFILLTSVFFPGNQTPVLFGMTLLGWVMALGVSWLLRATLVRGKSTPFVMELPPYRLPTWRGLVIHTWERTSQYLKKAGSFILAVSIVLWAAMTFPGLPADREAAFEAQKTEIAAKIDALAPAGSAEEAPAQDGAASAAVETEGRGAAPTPASPDDAKKEAAEAPERAGNDAAAAPAPAGDETVESLKAKLSDLDNAKAAETLASSLAGRLGTALEPVSKLAGFDWRTNIALVGGLAAKEVVISTLGTAYSLGKVDKEDMAPLSEMLSAEGKTVWAGLALMVFILIYPPCVPSIVSIAKETGSWKWSAFSMTFNTVLAFLLATAIFQLGTALF